MPSGLQPRRPGISLNVSNIFKYSRFSKCSIFLQDSIWNISLPLREKNLNRYLFLLPVNMLQELSLAFQRDRFVTFGLLDYVCRTHNCVPVSGDKYGWKTPIGKWYPMWVALCDHYLIFASSWFLLDSHSVDQCDECDWHSGEDFFTHTVGKM